jgi:thymidylate kinase
MNLYYKTADVVANLVLLCASGYLLHATFWRRTTKPGIFIVVEGLDGTGKSTVVQELAIRLNAIPMITPPNSMRAYRSYFDRVGGAQREAYYMIGNFIAATDIRSVITRGESAVVDRFYSSTKSYILGKDVDRELPPIGSEEYEWPPELLQPTITFFLTVDEDVRLQRREKRVELAETQEEGLLRQQSVIGQRINEAYRRFGCVEIDASGTVADVIECIVAVLKERHLI